MSLCWYFRKFTVSVATPPDANMHICAGSSVYAAQTTRRYCYLQTVCFFRRFIKKHLRELFLVQTWPSHLQDLLRSAKG
ncbi:hypothetical protein HanRHA438_Chr13g0583841 [Helianthus annuus]|nr:hypothetical protein HanHA300_Chr13g0469361 [Helianthus annuus]KAJ0479755.1 hypothetical protein HanIR_Chr13g0623661 [Helianthus annuus]KAJ0662608.1 hypothetical protein HanLR1_Chr13g0471551 [Helianthus annuus]KAJ0670124.1 hypothetical protein HanOQP8_Chr13g0470551 [Helianthus annuus]KAJ0847948.1 hypothetical protein HanPSC8_Chr13g0551321 [Helianthus annuus]